MKTGVTTLPSFTGYNIPILVALDWYGRHSNLNFWQEATLYLNQGYLISTPAIFAMGYWIKLKEEPAFFIRYAVGRLDELVSHLPKGTKWAAFCRNGEDDIRRYSLDRLSSLRNIGSLTSPIFSMNGLEEKH